MTSRSSRCSSTGFVTKTRRQSSPTASCAVRAESIIFLAQYRPFAVPERGLTVTVQEARLGKTPLRAARRLQLKIPMFGSAQPDTPFPPRKEATAESDPTLADPASASGDRIFADH